MNFFVKGKENSLELEFMNVIQSLYSGESSTLIVPNWSSTFGSRSEEFFDVEEDSYDPLTDRFSLSGIKVNGNEYLQRSTESTFVYPAAEFLPSKVEILHGPDIINGHLDGHLFLGVITSAHNKLGLSYNWFLNGNIFSNGPHCCLIKISEQGTYNCRVMYGEMVLESASVTVVAGSQSACQEPSREEATNANIYPPSMSIATLIEAGKLTIKK